MLMKLLQQKSPEYILNNYFYVHDLKYYSTVYVHEWELLKPLLNIVQLPPL